MIVLIVVVGSDEAAQRKNSVECVAILFAAIAKELSRLGGSTNARLEQ